MVAREEKKLWREEQGMFSEWRRAGVKRAMAKIGAAGKLWDGVDFTKTKRVSIVGGGGGKAGIAGLLGHLRGGGDASPSVPRDAIASGRRCGSSPTS